MAQGLKTGQTLQGGKYRIERVLGQGSFGITYLAKAKFTTQGNLGSMQVEAQVAIKEFFMGEVNERHSDGSSVEGSAGSVFTNYRNKFRKEAQNLSKLSHGNIVKVFDVFDENNTTYYVMEFLEGTNLDEHIKNRGQLPEDEAIETIKVIGDALAYMHSRKMLHLDIKPKNVMRTADGTYKLIDFGLSKQYTETGEPESSSSIGLGTPGYAPLDQLTYKQDGTFPATLDVYALGATLFKMLTGKRPPEATTILNEGFPEADLKAAGVSPHTIAAVEKAMSPMRKQRYQTVAEFLEALAKEKNIGAGEVTVVAGPKAKSTVQTVRNEGPKIPTVPPVGPQLPPLPPTPPARKPKSNLKLLWIVIPAAIILPFFCYFLFNIVASSIVEDDYDYDYVDTVAVEEVYDYDIAYDTTMVVDTVEYMEVIAE